MGDYDSDNDSTNESYVSGTLDGIVDLYKTDLVLSRDYSPFGVTLDGRNFNRQTCDTITVITQDTTLYETFPGSYAGEFLPMYAGNNVGNVGGLGKVRANGSGNLGMYRYVHLETGTYTISFTFDHGSVSLPYQVYTYLRDSATNTMEYTTTGVITDGNYSFTVPNSLPAGTYRLEFERIPPVAINHSFYIDNLCLSVTDTSTQINCDGKGDYRFAFNGMEKDDEVKGENNSYDFGARLYDSRLGKWLTPDKGIVQHAAWSTYRYGFDSPILYTDPDGNTEYVSVIITDRQTGGQIILRTTRQAIMTDGVKHDVGNGAFWTIQNYFYDFETKYYIDIMPDGSTRYTYKNTIIKTETEPKNSDYVFGSGAKHGETKADCWFCDDSQAGGYELTSKSGGADPTTTRSLNFAETIAADELLAALGGLPKGGTPFSSKSAITKDILTIVKGLNSANKRGDKLGDKLLGEDEEIENNENKGQAAGNSQTSAGKMGNDGLIRYEGDSINSTDRYGKSWRQSPESHKKNEEPNKTNSRPRKPNE